jgi:dihydroorotate dehydrogenase
MKATTLSRIEGKLRPALLRVLPECWAVRLYSSGRKHFLKALANETVEDSFLPPKNLSRNLWGMEFQSPLMNAAGMFKNGECYEMSAFQGAGAYLGGSGTWDARSGNVKNCFRTPFIPYPKSGAASNFLGLPNDGDLRNAQRACEIERVPGCPIGWSVAASTSIHEGERLKRVVDGLKLYMDAGVDFGEGNRSCPNTEPGKPKPYDLEVERRDLRYISENLLKRRERKFPVVMKYSNDTPHEQIPALMDTLFELGFDGVNFGNTSIQYEVHRDKIHPHERQLYNYFSTMFGGGVSGRPLKETSLELAAGAAAYVRAGAPSQEFHVFRTGGIDSWKDIEDSEAAGISMNQWFTGYFENLAQDGHNVYRRLFEEAA